ncbi:MAG: hypothetical protein R3F28_00795 [Candidatus Kapaibacterium sp.]
MTDLVILYHFPAVTLNEASRNEESHRESEGGGDGVTGAGFFDQ